jgi:hypothetical protein
VRMTKPQLHRHLTTGIFNQLSKILKKLRLSDFFLDRAAGNSSRSSNFARSVQRKLCVSALLSVFCATKPEYQVLPTHVNCKETSRSISLCACSRPQPIRTLLLQTPLPIRDVPAMTFLIALPSASVQSRSKEVADHLCYLSGWQSRTNAVSQARLL